MKKIGFFPARRLVRDFSGFTLIELLVATACIAILLVLFIPTLQTFLQRGKQVACMNTLRQLYMGARGFAGDNNDTIPWNVYDPATGRFPVMWILSASQYITGTTNVVLTCPSSAYSNGKSLSTPLAAQANYGMIAALVILYNMDGSIKKDTDTVPPLGRSPRFVDVQNSSSTVLFFDAGGYSMARRGATNPTPVWSWIPGYSKNTNSGSAVAGAFYSVPTVPLDAQNGRHGKTINFVHVDGSGGTTSANQFVNDTNYWNVTFVSGGKNTDM